MRYCKSSICAVVLFFTCMSANAANTADDLDNLWAGAEKWNALSNRSAASPNVQLHFANKHIQKEQWSLAIDSYRRYFKKYSLLAGTLVTLDEQRVAEESRKAILSMGHCQLMDGDLAGATNTMLWFKRLFPEYRYRFDVQRLQYFIGFRYFQAAASEGNQTIEPQWFINRSTSTLMDGSGSGSDSSAGWYGILLFESSGNNPATDDSWSAAMSVFKDILDNDPKSVFADHAMFCSGLLYHWNNENLNARKMFDKMIKLHSRSFLLPYCYLECSWTLLHIRKEPKYNFDWDRDAIKCYENAARSLAGAIGPIKRRLQSVHTLLRVRQARRKLIRARFYIANSENRAAEIVLEEVAQHFTGTPQALKAKQMLHELRK